VNGSGEVSGDDVVGERQVRPVGLTSSEAALDGRHPSGSARAIVLPSQRVHLVAAGKEMPEERDLVSLRGGMVHRARESTEKR
jgi:hypothetical protein